MREDFLRETWKRHRYTEKAGWRHRCCSDRAITEEWPEAQEDEEEGRSLCASIWGNEAPSPPSCGLLASRLRDGIPIAVTHALDSN